MARINSGVLGGFSGKIANVQGYNRFGKNILRSRGKKKDFVGFDRLDSQNTYTNQLAHLLNIYKVGITACLALDNITAPLDWEKILRLNRPVLNSYDKRYIIQCQFPSGQLEVMSNTVAQLNIGNSRINMTATGMMKLKQSGWLTHKRIIQWRSPNSFIVNNYSAINGDINNQTNIWSVLPNNRYQIVMFTYTHPGHPERYQSTFNIISKIAY